ncbi:hypothetical protein BOX15_Mlig006734g1 [Macrostomum lignano]|uniref:Uncharacterized protein n=2 Tax=Macrostomum lignano TaxID=282301 RepID=A0A267E9N6_9PLAT|nr:hypothetical protein BOX15_Mlig006734g1 [Macrostomum lignano]
MVTSLRKRCTQVICSEIRQLKLAYLLSFPPFIRNQLHDMMSRRSLTGSDSLLAAQLVTWATQRVDWSNFDEITDECVQHLSACKSLQSLNLNAMKGSREVPTEKILLTVLPHLANLREVQLRRCSQVTDSVVDALTAASGRRLRVLNLQGCSSCTDASLRHIAERCRCLGSLNLSGCSITDKGVAILAASPLSKLLSELQINQCVSITDASIRCLVDSCPKLSILTFTNCPLLTVESRIALETMQNRGKMKQLFWTVY